MANEDEKVIEQQEAEQVPPTSGMDFVRQMREEIQQERTEDPVERKDRQLGSIAKMDGWAHLKEWMERRARFYRELRGVDLDQLSDEDLGLRFRVGSLVADELEAIIQKVEAPAQYFKENDVREEQQE